MQDSWRPTIKVHFPSSFSEPGPPRGTRFVKLAPEALCVCGHPETKHQIDSTCKLPCICHRFRETEHAKD